LGSCTAKGVLIYFAVTANVISAVVAVVAINVQGARIFLNVYLVVGDYAASALCRYPEVFAIKSKPYKIGIGWRRETYCVVV